MKTINLRIIVLAILVVILIVILLAAFFPSPANADGGPIVPPDLWANLEEGQQIGVVTIIDEDTARMDLFISILDRTPVSHEITFFVPIGINTSAFNAYEEDLFDFDRSTTRRLDKILRDSATERQRAVQALFSGALLTNGSVLVPLWAPVLLTGCGAAAPLPEEVITTESSQISIYGIDDNTDLDALIQTTGLAPSVLDTLESLRGQQIAIVNLTTKPASEAPEDEHRPPWEAATDEPGLHLSWTTSFVPTGAGKKVYYPLGTGAAWAKPIELTRVYIVAPPGLDFDVQYPELGADKSGYDIIYGSNIQDFIDIPAYAVDEARGDFGRVWRATYTQSNPTDDVIITAKAQSAFSRFFAGLEEGALGYSIVFALCIGILVWVLAWRFLMPVFLGKGIDYVVVGWYEALIYPAINFVFIIFPGSILYLIFLIGGAPVALAIQFVIGAAVSIGVFTLLHSKRLDVSRGKAIGAFILTSLSSSAAYLLLAVAFAFFVNAL